MSDVDPTALEGATGLNTLLQQEVLRKARAEADAAEALARQQKAAAKRALKDAADEPASPGVVAQGADPPAQETPQAAAGDSGTEAPAAEVKGAAKPREGTISLDEKAGYLSTIVAYRAMLRLADAAAEAINGLDMSGAKILLVDSLAFAAADTAVSYFSSQIAAWLKELRRLDRELASLIAQGRAAALPAVSQLEVDRLATTFMAGAAPLTLLPLLIGAVSATADLIGYFKTDYAISGRDVAVTDQAIRARVAGKITGAVVYWQDFYRIQDSPLLKEFAKVLQAQADVQQKLDLLKSTVVDPLDAQIAALGARIEKLQAAIKGLKLPQQAQEKAELEAQIAASSEELAKALRAKKDPDLLYAQARGTLAVMDSNVQKLTAVAEGQELSALGRAALRDYLDVLGITHLLYVGVASAGGEVVTGKNWFLGAPQAGYLAGGVISYVLSGRDGAIVAADTLAGTDYLTFKLGQDVLA